MTVIEAVGEARALCDSLGVFIDANKRFDVGPEERLLDAETLAAKCLFHACSCLLLAGGTPIRTASLPVLDLGSINVLVRATLESALVFDYLFASPEDAASKELRYWSWVLADLRERQNVDAADPRSQQVQREERQEIDQITARLGSNVEFQKLSAGRKKEILQKGRWNPGWTLIARAAGLSQMHATVVHRYLSSHAHSGNLSVVQLRTPKTRDDQETLLGVALQLVCIGVAVMTKDYWSVFAQAAAAQELHAQAVTRVQEWLRIGAGGTDELGSASLA